MVRHHVAQCADLFVKATAALGTYSFGRCDLDVVDMVAIPERLKNAVGKAQHQDILNRFFAEEVIDPIDLVFRQHPEDLGVKGLRRRKIVPKGLFDDHPAPRFLRLVVQSCVTELFDDWPEEALADSQIVQNIGGTGLLSSLSQQPVEMSEGFGLRKIRRHIVHAMGKP